MSESTKLNIKLKTLGFTKDDNECVYVQEIDQNFKYEHKYFNLPFKLSGKFDNKTGILSFEKLDKKLYKILDKIESEILENATVLTGNDRESYYNSLREKATRMDQDYTIIKGNLKIQLHEIIGQQSVDERKRILGKHKVLIVQIIKKCFPDLLI